MCGRTTSYTPPERLAEVFDADLAPDLDRQPDGPHWNVGPTNNLFGLAVPRASDRNDAPLVLDAYRWGLIPPWSRDRSQGNRLFNARAETLRTKPAYREAFRARRLAVVVDGFYEWRKDAAGKRQPFYFHRADGFPMAFAGLWEVWKDHETRTWLRSCTIVTTTAGPDLQDIHNRMPVILERAQLERWLRPGDPPQTGLMSLLRPAPADTLIRYPVDPRIGNVRNDSPDLLRPVELREPHVQQQMLLP
jgi:putative SOS response-associated peptidase YedK